MSHVTVIPLFEGQQAYIDAARAHPPQSLASLWQQYVIEPWWPLWGEGQFNEARVRENVSSPVLDLNGLQRVLSALQAAGVEAQVQAIYEHITRYLPSALPERAVALLALDPADTAVSERMGGVVGECVGDNILLRVNPVEGWLDWLKYTLAHEYHHASWGYHHYALKGRQGWQLLDALITEGEADSFARLLYPHLSPNWISALTPEQELEQWEALRPLLSSSDSALYPRFMFGDAVTPPGTGYTIGYHIVQAYLRRHPAEIVSEWLDHDPQAILAGSGYDGIFASA